MRPEERDAAYLWDMLQSARDAAAIAKEHTASQMQRDRVRMLALERSMELMASLSDALAAGFAKSTHRFPGRKSSGYAIFSLMNTAGWITRNCMPPR